MRCFKTNNQLGFSLVETLVAVAVLSLGTLAVMNTTTVVNKLENDVSSTRVEAIALIDIFRVLEAPSICTYTIRQKADIYPGSGVNLIPLYADIGSAAGGGLTEIFAPGTDGVKFGSFGQSMELKTITLSKYEDAVSGSPPPVPGQPRLRLAELSVIYDKGGSEKEIMYNILVYTKVKAGQEVMDKCWTGGDLDAYICQHTLGGVMGTTKCNGMTFNNVQFGHNKPTYGSYNTVDTTSTDKEKYQDRGSVFLMDELRIGQDGSIFDPSTVVRKGVITPGRLVADKIQVNGSVMALDSSYAFNYKYLSDRRLKKNIRDLTANQAKQLLKLNPVSYKLKTDPQGKLRFGFKAQEVRDIFPEAVTEKFDYLMVDYGTLIAPLVKQAQNQENEIVELEARLRKIKQLR